MLFYKNVATGEKKKKNIPLPLRHKFKRSFPICSVDSAAVPNTYIVGSHATKYPETHNDCQV